MLIREKNKPEEFFKEKLAEELVDIFPFLATNLKAVRDQLEKIFLKR